MTHAMARPCKRPFPAVITGTPVAARLSISLRSCRATRQSTRLSTAASNSSSIAGPDEDNRFMALALEQARMAAAEGEVPVGAVIVHQGSVIAAQHNRVHNDNSPIAHAELLCIQQAAAQAAAWRLLDTTLYVTLEPCPMCAGAILQSRIRRVVYGAPQPRLGADGGWIHMLSPPPGALEQMEEERQRKLLRQRLERRQRRQAQQQQQQQDQGGPSDMQPVGVTSGQKGGASLTEQPWPPAGGGVTQPATALHAQGAAGIAWKPHPFHTAEVTRGVMAEECAEVMRQFFKRQREQPSQAGQEGPGIG